MTTDVKVLIAEFLRTHKRLVVPQLGAFIAVSYTHLRAHET